MKAKQTTTKPAYSRKNRAGRQGGIANVPAKWALAMDAALVQFAKTLEGQLPNPGGDDFVVRWAADWLVAYAAGWVAGPESNGGALGETLRRVVDGALYVDLAPIHLRALLAIATESALKVRPKQHGEDKPKTPPNLVRNIGGMVEAQLFEPNGAQPLTLSEALKLTAQQLTKLCPRQNPPFAEKTIRAFHATWRAEQQGLPSVRKGRPKKEP